MAARGQKATGAVLLYAGVGGGLSQKRPLLLGTGERGPRYLIERAWKPYFNDLGGSMMPFDEQFSGARALTSIDLNWWDQEVLEVCESVPGLTGEPGGNVFFDQGTFMVGEGAAYPVWLVFTKAVTPAMRRAKLPLGIRFPFSWLMGPDTHETGSDAKKINLIWRHQRGFVQGGSGALGFVFADNNIAGLPAFTG